MVEDGPVDRRGSSVAFDAWMHDKALDSLVDILRDGLHESRAYYNIRIEGLHCLPHRFIRGGCLEACDVAFVLQDPLNTLRETIVSRGNQQDSEAL